MSTPIVIDAITDTLVAVDGPKSSRGPDRKPRVRRTRAQIEADIKASTSVEATRELVTELTNDDEPEETPATNIPVIGVSYEPLGSAPTSNAPSLETAVVALSNKLVKQVLDGALASVEEKAAEIMAKVTAAARPNNVVMHIKFNKEAVKPLTKEAHPQLADILGYLSVGLNTMLVGPAGCGKTFAAEQAAEALGLPFEHISCSAGMSETWLYGRQTPAGYSTAGFIRVYEFGGVFLFDELDACDSNTLMSVNMALANGHVNNPITGKLIKRHKDAYFIATANTFGKGGNAVYSARNRLDGTSIDRYTPIYVTYDEKIEQLLCPSDELRHRLRRLRSDVSNRNAQEIISYRSFQKATALRAIGKTPTEIISILTASWPESLRKELGVK